jgi:predicted ATP-dependent endonuclease of OLD family
VGVFMKIKAIEVKNLFSYDDFKIEFNEGNIAVIVGPNNAGKTNLFRILEFLKDVIDEVMSYRGNIVHRKDLIGRKMFMYQNNPNKNSYIAIRITLDKKEQKLIDDFLKCCFERVIRSLESRWKYIMDYDNIQILNEILNCIEEIKKIEKKYGDLSELYTKDRQTYIKIHNELLSQLISKITKLSLYLIIKNIPKFLSNGMLIWKYAGEYERLSYPVYCTIVKNPEINNEDIQRKIEILKEYLKKQYDKYGNINHDYRICLKALEITEAIFCNRLLIKLDGVSISFKKIDNLKDYTDTNLEQLLNDILNNDILNILPGNLTGNSEWEIKNNISHWEIRNDTVAFYNPKILKSEISESLKATFNKICEYVGYEEPTLHDLVLSICKNEILFMKGAISYPEKDLELNKDMNIVLKLKNLLMASKYDGNGKDLAKYLLHLKNYDLERFNEIKETLKIIFKQENIHDFDIFISENILPEIRIMFRDNSGSIRQFPIENVGSGIFEVLNILAVVIGAEEKVILLDEPALHLHPKYQKKLLNILKGEFNLGEDKEITEETKNILKNVKKCLEKNQVIIITHSPYFVDAKLLSNTFRFYRDKNGKTKNICVGKVVKNLYKDKIQKKFEENETKKRLLFANGVLLTEGGCEYHSLPILLEKIGYSPEDYNLEIVNVRGKDGFKEYIELLNSLRIPFGIVCDGETAFNIYKHNRIKEEKAKKIIKKLNKILDEEGISEDEIKNKIKEIVEKYNTDYELKNKNDYSTIINAFKEVFNNSEKHPFWLENSEYKEIFNNITKEMEKLRKKLENSKKRLKTYEEVESTCIEPLYNKFADILKEKLFIFACKEYDWTGFLGIKKDEIEKCIQRAYEFDDKEKLKDLENFIKNFINKRINHKINHNTTLNTFKDGDNHDYS